MDLSGLSVFFVGIKGTGMSALADLYQSAGALVSGSDISEEFYTDQVLKGLGIDWVESFDASLLPKQTQLVIYSSAYRPDENPQLIEAKKRHIPLMEYTQALGLYSQSTFSVGICGVHGKTTTTAMCGSVMKALALRGSVLVGSALPQFSNRSIWSGGENFFVAETCEYRRHFLDFHPSVLVLTSVEPDHLDYFKDANDIESAFIEYGAKLPAEGTLIYCADDEGATRCAHAIFAEGQKSGRDLQLIPYGYHADGNFQIVEVNPSEGKNRFKIKLFDSYFDLSMPGRHLVQNAAAVIACMVLLGEREHLSLDAIQRGIEEGLSEFHGTRRRSERVGEAKGILVLDDYAHHPSAIRLTLQGFREFYPNRRIIVDFMSHTYSRTEALLSDFAQSFDCADLVLLNKVYSSAREQKGTVDGHTLYKECCKYHSNVYYFDEYEEALPFLLKELKEGDLFITMGAGNNWQLGRALLEALQKDKEENND